MTGRANPTTGLHGTARQLALVVFVLMAAALVGSGCGASTDSAAADPDAEATRGGSMVIGMDQQPNCLNSRHVCGGMAATSMVTDSIFESLLGTNADGTYYPIIATEVPTTDNGRVVELPDGRMKVTVEMVPEAVWSDNQPITCADIRFTWKTMMDEKNLIGSRIGWDMVESVTCPAERRAVFMFTETYAPYQLVVGGAPLPKHILEGKDFNTFLNNDIPVASGPFKFKSWRRNVDIVLERNENYWRFPKQDKPMLDELRFRFIADTNTLKIQLRTGEVDWISPPPDTSLAQELETFPRSSFQVEPGIYWEQLALNNGKFPTDDPAVRKALAYATDRDQITETVLRGQTTRLDSVLLPALKDYYVPAFEGYVYDPDKAQQVLEEAGWTRNGAYYEKGGKPLLITFKSTAGNALRQKVAQVLQQGYRDVGIKMDIKLETPEVFFGQSTIQGSFNMGLWAWSSTAEPRLRGLFSCDEIPNEANDYAGNNYYRYCDPAVDKLLLTADVSPDLGERSAAVKELQVLMAADAPVIPLFQRPDTIAYSNHVRGIVNAPLSGTFWNVYDWGVVAK